MSDHKNLPVDADRKASLAGSDGEGLLRMMVENSLDGIYLLDLNTGQYVFVSPTQAEMTGFTPEELLTMTAEEARDRVHPDDREVSISQQKKAAEDRNGAVQAEYRWKVKSGVYRWFSDKRKLVRDARGRPIALVGVSRDITERKQAEEALHRSLDHLHLAQEAAKAGSWEWDLQTNENVWSEEIWGIYGIEPHSCKPSFAAWLQTVHADDRANVARSVQEAAAAGLELRAEWRIWDRNGLERWLMSRGQPQRNAQGRVIRYIGIVMDISERKQAELALQRLNASLEQRVSDRTKQIARLADQLRGLAMELTQAENRERQRLAKILHDHIQQLLVSARMQLSLLKRGDGELIQSVTQGIDSTLAEALTSSRSLTAELFPTVLHQSGLVAALHWLAARKEEKYRFHVDVLASHDAEPATPELRVFLFESVREVILNAVKHSGVNEARLTMLRTEDGCCRIIFEDGGKGFDPGSLAPSGSGGFGLFSIQQRILHLGGRLEIESAPSKGTRVVLTVPIGTAQPIPVPATAANAADAVQFGEKREKIHVLLVDDHRIMRQGLRSLLQFENDIVLVGEAEDGRQAIELARRHKPDVAIMDINMPIMNGIEATRILTKELPFIKVIGLSMHMDVNMKNSMRKAGAVAYLSKDGRSEELVETIRACYENNAAMLVGDSKL